MDDREKLPIIKHWVYDEVTLGHLYELSLIYITLCHICY
jgi:hypothetical protein